MIMKKDRGRLDVYAEENVMTAVAAEVEDNFIEESNGLHERSTGGETCFKKRAGRRTTQRSVKGPALFTSPQSKSP